MSAQTMRNQLQANADANGNASMQLAGNWELNHNSAWRLFVQLQGILNGVITVLVDGIPVDGGLSTNLQFKCGPIFINQNSTLIVNVTGMTPLETVSCYLDGIVSDNVSDFAALAPPGYGGGSVQNDPSQLLSAQLGSPLVENQTYGVLGSGVHNSFVGTFSIAGYGALLCYGKCPNAVAAQALYAVLRWEDKFGNVLSYSQIDCLSPQFICFFGTLGTQVSIFIGNTSGNQVNVNTFTVIPLTAMPSDPGRYIPQAFGNIPNFQVINTPPANAIMSFNQSVAPSVTQTITGDFVWYGEAFFTISPVTSGAGGNNNWWAQLFTVDADANITYVDVLTGVNVGGAPRNVFLPAGTPTVLFHNISATTTITPIITLLAA